MTHFNLSIFQRFIDKLHHEQHPLRILNHLFHDSVDISYRNVVMQSLEERKRRINADSKTSLEGITELYHLYQSDCQVLIEELQKDTFLGLTDKNQYINELKKILSQLDNQPLLDRRRALKGVHQDFQSVIERITHEIAAGKYSNLVSVATDIGEQTTTLDKLINDGKGLTQPLDRTETYSDISKRIKSIDTWRKKYDGLKPEEARYVSQRLNTDNDGSKTDIRQTVEYQLADLYLKYKSQLESQATVAQRRADPAEEAPAPYDFVLTFTAQPQQEPGRRPGSASSQLRHRLVADIREDSDSDEEDSDSDSELRPLHTGFSRNSSDAQSHQNDQQYQYLSQHLYENLDDRCLSNNSLQSKFGVDTYCEVVPDTTLAPSDMPGLNRRSSGKVSLSENTDDDRHSDMSALTDDETTIAPRGTVTYNEFTNKAQQIALITNTIEGGVKSAEIATILSEQVKYLQTVENKPNIADSFVFRIDFTSEAEFQSYKQNGTLQRMLLDFSNQHPEFKVKVVIQNKVQPQNDTVYRFDSLSSLLDSSGSLQATRRRMGLS